VKAHRGVLVVVAGAAVVAAGLAGCSSSGDKAPARAGATGPGAAGSVPATAAASSAPPAVYKTVDDLCASVDLTSLTQLFPKQSQTRHTTNATAVMTEMRCSAALEASTSARGYLQIAVNVSKDPQSTRSMYEGLRGAETKTAPGGKVTDVPRIGSAAYTFVDEGLGPRLVVTDGNLYMTLVWSSHGEPASSIPPDIVTRLGAVCTATMAKLRA
jgi:hypothetical protein